MADIFFSYKSVDHDRVGVIRDILTAQGFDVFWDQEVEPGVTPGFATILAECSIAFVSA